MNLLTDVIPAQARRYLYAAYAIACTAVGALAIANVDVGKAPDVLAYLGIALGATAASNVTSSRSAKSTVTITANGLTATGGILTAATTNVDPVKAGRDIQAALDAYHAARGEHHK